MHLAVVSWLMVVLGVLITTLVALLLNMVRHVRILLNIFLDMRVSQGPTGRPMGGEAVEFRSLDGTALSGTFFAGATAPRRRGVARGTVIFCHEYGDDGSSLVKYAMFLREAGFNLFTFDFRGHGRSSRAGRYRPLLWPTRHEVLDVLGAVAYVRSRPEVGEVPVGLFGVSRGGSTAILAAAQSDCVGAVVSDGAFCTRLTLHAYMRRWVGIFTNLHLYHRLPDWVYGLVRQVALVVAQARLRVLFPSVRRAIARISPRPVFLIHGERDSHIDTAQAEALFHRAREPKWLWIVPGARHNESIVHAGGGYRSRVIGFFETHLRGAPAPAEAAYPEPADIPLPSGQAPEALGPG